METRESLLIPEPQLPPIDTELFDRLTHAAGNLDVFYEALDPVGDLEGALKDHFGDPETAGQTFSFDRWDFVQPENTGEFTIAELRLRRLKEEIRSQMKVETDPQQQVVLQLYRWKVNEYIAKARMVRHAAAGDGAVFEHYNVFVYDKPDADIFAAVCDEFRATAQAALESNHTPVREAAARVLQLVPDKAGDRNLLRPDDETFQRIRAGHYAEGGYFALLLAGAEVPEKGPIKPEVGEPILQVVQRNIGAEHYARRPSKGKAWSVNHADPQVKGPMEYSMPLKRFIGLPVGHEIGTHTLEHQNGLRQSLRLLSVGLDRIERGEGRALVREQVPYETFDEFAKTVRWQDVMRRQFVSGMMANLHGGDASLDTIFRTLSAVDTLREVMANPDDPQAAAALNRTASLLARVYVRGIYKDTAYLEGNVLAWQNSERIADGDNGKYDIVNPRHLRALAKLGIVAASE